MPLNPISVLVGSVVAILPGRVARRRAGELVEIKIPPASIAKGADGTYKIMLISEPGCSPQENQYIAQELRSLI